MQYATPPGGATGMSAPEAYTASFACAYALNASMAAVNASGEIACGGQFRAVAGLSDGGSGLRHRRGAIHCALSSRSGVGGGAINCARTWHGSQKRSAGQRWPARRPAATTMGDGEFERLPVRAVKKERRTERRTVFVILSDERVLLHRRDSRGLLAGLWELPGVDGWLSSEEAVAAAARWGMTQETEAEELKPGRHIFSHVEWHMRGYRLESVSFEAPPGFLWADARQLREDFALPSAFRPFADYLPEQKQTGDL